MLTFGGQIDVGGDLYSALALKGYFEGLALPWRDKPAMLLDAWRFPALVQTATSSSRRKRLAMRFSSKHMRQKDKQAIAFHHYG